MKAFAIFAAAVGFAACALGETDTAEPDEFLEYIEATGSQYLDTGVNAETGLKAQIDFAWASGNISTNDWSLLDATIDNSVSSKRTRFLMCHLYGGGGKPYFGYGKQRKNPAGSVPFVGGQRCEIITDMTDPDSLELYQDGVKTFNEEDLETFKTDGVVNLHLNLFVFACNLSSVPKWHGQGRLYELNIWKKNLESGELDLVRHYLPCIKDGRAGLYDTVHSTISYSYTTDNFIAGPVISDEPTLITTREGLAAISDNLAGSYALGAEIDLGDTDWTPIGNNVTPFTGTLRGNGHAIRNLFCTNSLSGADYRGLFGCVSNERDNRVRLRLGNGRGQAVRRRSRWMHHGRNGHQQLHRDCRGRGDQHVRRRPDRGVCRRQRGQSNRRLPCGRLREWRRLRGRLHRLRLRPGRDLQLRGAWRRALRRQFLRLRRFRRAARP